MPSARHPVTQDAAMKVMTPDGRALYVERHGHGSPVVVFEAGMGVSGNMWGALLPQVARQTTAVIYDRSGFGRSRPDSATRDLARLSDDLLAVIACLGDGPLVLVGHSWGGPIVRLAAARIPERIAGLVLVDQTDEGCELFFSASHARQARMSRWLLPLMARTGLLRWLVKRQSRDLPEPWASALRHYDGSVAAAHAMLAELEHCMADIRRLRDQPVALPPVPVSIISGTRDGFMEKGRRKELVKAHLERAEALPFGRHVQARHSSHFVPLTEPDVIVSEILRIIGA